MLSSVPEVPLATCTGAVSPVVTAVPRAGGHAEQAWPVPGWARHGPDWVRHGPGWAPDSPRREWQIQQPGQARQRARAMPVASRTDTGSGSAAAESSSRYPGARRSSGRPASNSPDRRNCAAVASADTLISLATRVTNRWPANQRGYKDRLRELPEGRGHHAAGLGG